MPAYQILGAWRYRGSACAAVAVAEVFGRTEYIACVPDDDEFQALTLAQKKQALLAALVKIRNIALETREDLGITGSGNI